jgi:uncharacterized membrane protein YhhN
MRSNQPCSPRRTNGVAGAINARAAGKIQSLDEQNESTSPDAKTSASSAVEAASSSSSERRSTAEVYYARVTVAAVVLAVALVALLIAEQRKWHGGVWICKPLASLAFVAMAVAGGAAENRIGQTMLAALILSLAGDVLLIPKSKAAFLAGLFAFLGGHLAFAVAFVERHPDWRWTAVAAAPLLVAGFLVGRWLLPQVERKMRGPVAAYMLVVSSMVALAAGAVGAASPSHLRDFGTLIAAVAFYLSDVSVAIDRFVRPGFGNRAWGLPLYYGAQAGFALVAAGVLG